MIWRGLNDGPVPRAANDNTSRKHRWPARDQARAGTLMSTPADNEVAHAILIRLRALVDASESRPWLAIGSDEPYRVDRIRGMGPTPENLKKFWEADAPGNDDGEIPNDELMRNAVGKDCTWKAGYPAIAMTKTTYLDKEVGFVRQVGRLLFNESGNLTALRGTKGWLPVKETLRGVKGKRAERPAVDDPVDLSDYRDAAIPRDPRTGEIGIEFLAGKTRTSADGGANIIDLSEHMHRRVHSEFHPPNAWMTETPHREEAHEELNCIRERLGPTRHEALVDAACGVRFSDIGGGKVGDSRAARQGMELVRSALRMMM
jgi:hypothetical protein